MATCGRRPPLRAWIRSNRRWLGRLRVQVTIGGDGPPDRTGARLPATARQWVWNPMLLNGNPAEVVVRVDVAFSLRDNQEQRLVLHAPTVY